MTARRPVIVAYDGTDEARTALLWALHETAPNDPLIPVAVLGHEPSPLPVISHLPSRPEERSRIAKAIATSWDVDGQALRGVVELRFEHGHPAETLAEIAEAEGAEMIVIGHHRGRHAAALRASVTEDLLRIAPCPVVVVP